MARRSPSEPGQAPAMVADYQVVRDSCRSCCGCSSSCRRRSRLEDAAHEQAVSTGPPSPPTTTGEPEHWLWPAERRGYTAVLRGRRVLRMAADGLRSRLNELLGFAVPPTPDLLVRAERERDGYVEQVVSYTGHEGNVAALRPVPEQPRGAWWRFINTTASGIWARARSPGWRVNRCRRLGPRLRAPGSWCSRQMPSVRGSPPHRPGYQSARTTDFSTSTRWPTGSLLLLSATEDRYSADTPEIVRAAARAYREAGAPQALQHHRAQGGHALTKERFDTIIDWVTAQLSEN